MTGKFSKWEDEEIKRLYKRGDSIKAIASYLDRTEISVHSRVCRLRKQLQMSERWWKGE